MADRISQVPVEVIAANVPVPPPRATWRTAVITVPSSPGSGSVTGLGGQPRALLFFGTNWATEDAVVTTAHVGMFRGMAGPKYDDASLIQSAAFITPPGDCHAIDNYGILALDTSGLGTNLLYRATIDSLDVDGFSYTFDTAAAGGYKVVCIALMDDDTNLNVGSYLGTLGVDIPLGWEAKASLYHGAWGGPVTTGDDRTQEWYGGAVYGGMYAAAFLSTLVFPTSNSGQTYNEIAGSQNPTFISAWSADFFTAFMQLHAVYTGVVGTYSDELRFSLTSGGPSGQGGMIVVWNDEDSANGYKTPAASAGGTSVQTGLTFEPGLLIGYSLSDEVSGTQVTGGPGAAGFFVVTPDFQWCALVDGTPANGAFQSFQRGFCDHVDTADVHAGTIALTEDGFVMTTVEDALSQQQITWHAFGHPAKRGWIPQIVRYL